MKKYELTIVLPGSFTPAKIKSANGKIEKIIKAEGGKVTKVIEWGKLDLAYPIGKEGTGIFSLFNLELKAKAATEIDTKLNLVEEVIRYLLVRKE